MQSSRLFIMFLTAPGVIIAAFLVALILWPGILWQRLPSEHGPISAVLFCNDRGGLAQGVIPSDQLLESRATAALLDELKKITFFIAFASYSQANSKRLVFGSGDIQLLVFEDRILLFIPENTWNWHSRTIGKDSELMRQIEEWMRLAETESG